MIHNTTLTLFLQLAGAMAPPATSTHANTAPAQSFQLIDLEPKRVAYIEHTGPYWSLGTAVERVAEDAKSFGQAGSLIVRYVHDPSLSTPGRLKTLVGFELRGSEEPKAPYQTTVLPAALAATRTVEGPDSLSTRHFSALRVWALKQGLVPESDLIALVSLSEKGQSTSIAHSELILPVCLPDPPMSEPAEPQQQAENPANSGALVATPLPEQPRRLVTKVIPLDDSKPVEVELHKREGEIEPSHAAQVEVVVVEPEVVVPAPKQKVEFVPIREWIEAGHFDKAATALLLDSSDAATHQWADQFASRIVAVANGVHKQWPGEEGWLTPLGAQLTSRRLGLKRENAKVTARAVLQSPVESKAPEQKALTRELDLLMGQIAYRTLSPDQVRERLMDLMEAAVALELP